MTDQEIVELFHRLGMQAKFSFRSHPDDAEILHKVDGFWRVAHGERGGWFSERWFPHRSNAALNLISRLAGIPSYRKDAPSWPLRFGVAEGTPEPRAPESLVKRRSLRSDLRKVVADGELVDLLGGVGLAAELVSLDRGLPGRYSLHEDGKRWVLVSPKRRTTFKHHGDAVLALFDVMSRDVECRVDYVQRTGSSKYGDDTATDFVE